MDTKKLMLALMVASLIVIAWVSLKLSVASSPPNTSSTAMVSAVHVAAASAAPVADAKLVPLKLELPKLAFIGTPPEMRWTCTNIVNGSVCGKVIEGPAAPEVCLDCKCPKSFVLDEHTEPPSEPKGLPVLMVPPGTVNLALNKKVTCSDKSPSAGTPELVTDGNKEATDDSFLQMRRGVQWVQIDLEQPSTIFYILVWHAHNAMQIYHSVVIQIADDADFTQNLRTVFNNDYKNEAGLGMGKDKEYFESFEGRWIPVKGEKARFIRSYSKGSTYSAMNRCTEIEVYGIPVR
jgi:hypothetical protein